MVKAPQVREAIVPLFVFSDEQRWQFAGTGFFLKHCDRIVLVTAGHVEAGKKLFIFRQPDTEGKPFTVDNAMHETNLLIKSKGTDLAILDPLGFQPKDTLTIANDIPGGNIAVGSFEYARFTVGFDGNYDHGASARLGNIVRLLNDPRFPSNSIELSYPALRGASGAPVMVLQAHNADVFKVVGVVVANFQYELMPAQTYVYKDSGDQSEETTHYYLPSGLAVNRDHLAALLEKLDNSTRK